MKLENERFMPARIEIELEPVEKGRVQIMARLTLEDRNDLVRASNYTGLNQQDVMRMFLVRGIRKFLATVAAQQPSGTEVGEVVHDTTEG